MIEDTRLLLIGLAASGKSTLSHALAKRLALPCYRIDDYRRWLGDYSIAADYRARAAFLDTCSSKATGIFEFSAVGHHREAVRHAMKEQNTPLTIINVECDEATRKNRLALRIYDTPYPDWGVGPENEAAVQKNRLRQDVGEAFWTTETNWTQIQVRGDEPVERALYIIINHLGVQPKTEVRNTAKLHIASGEWMAAALQLPESTITPVEAQPATRQSTADQCWEISSPELEKHQLHDLLAAFEHVGWHTLLTPIEPDWTRLSALSPSHERYVEVTVCQRCEISAKTCAADFVYQLERASAARAANNATAWFTGASIALQSLKRCWWYVQAHDSSNKPALSFIQLPNNLKLLYRNCAPSLDLAQAAMEADRIYDLSINVLAELRQYKHACLTVSILDSWLPVLRTILETRDALWNFRDVAANTDGYLRRGILFRGSSPTRYYNDSRYADSGLFERWRHSTGVTRVIDLRTAVETEASPYPIERLSTFTVNHQPTEGHLLRQRGESAPELAREYLAFFEEYPAVFKEAAVCITEAKQAILIHCFAGIYRTGVVVAILCYLCDVPRAMIISNYLAGGESARLECIEVILERLEQIGGPSALANHLNISDECLATLQERLIE